MMKRQPVGRLGAGDDPPQLPPHSQQPLSQPPVSQMPQQVASNMHTLAQSAQPQIIAGATTMLSVGAAGFVRGARPPTPVINYLKSGALQYPAPKQPVPPPVVQMPRHKPLGSQSVVTTVVAPSSAAPTFPVTLHAPHQQLPAAGTFQRLKPLGRQCPVTSTVPPSPAATAVSVQPHPPHVLHRPQLPAVCTFQRLKPLGTQPPVTTVVPPATAAPAVTVAPHPPHGPQPPAGTFQRLKVEDALSYLDQVKYKFNTQPQVYNDFLDIMKEFKSQTIDTPGVITRVSNLFQGHPELIVGFNTFLPPGYKIEVQSNGQVSVSMPSPTSMGVAGVGAVGATVGSSVLLSVHHTPPSTQLVHSFVPVPPVPPSVTGGAIVHNLSVSAPAPPPQNTLHHIQQAHQQIEAGHHSQGVQSTGAHAPTAATGQPVEFNHAIEYVNKIKSRFSRQPDKYKRFLEILHAYQRGHREGKEPPLFKQQTEQEVYSQVAKLFENQDDLLAEFGQFLPDAKATPAKHHTAHQRSSIEGDSEPKYAPVPAPPPSVSPPHHQIQKHVSSLPSNIISTGQHHLKRSPSFSSQISTGAPPPKKLRPACVWGPSVRDVSHAEAAKYGTLQEYNFFDRVRHALKTPEVYDNFLRCLYLFINEVVSSSELIQITSPFFCRHPELQRWLHDFVGPVSPPHTPTTTQPPSYTAYNQPTASSLLGYSSERPVRFEPLGQMGAQLRHERPAGDAAMDVDLSTCKRLGTSYCALPRGSAEAASRRCSGRTPLCKEVLNDTWVSFPTWSEDSTFVTSRKTQYEEYIYRCEDERFELDVVIETNAATIRVLEGVQKKMSRMSSDDLSRYRLDDCLGGSSPTIHQRALRRIYGDKVSVDIIAGLKKNPFVAVPVVLRRLKAKEEEWREAQKGFNNQWREQNEKYYLKSLDHQGINFKQNDLKALRSKALFNELESAYVEGNPGPHLTVDYSMADRAEAIKIGRDAAELLIHHARRQTAIQKAEKRRIKQLLRQFLPDLFGHPRQPLSDDERDEEEKDEPTSPDSPLQDDAADVEGTANAIKQEKQESSESDNASEKSTRNNKNNKENTPKNNNTETNSKEHINPGLKRSSSNEEPPGQLKPDVKQEHDVNEDLKEALINENRFVCTMPWYLFLRLHGVLCQRLGAARRAAALLASEAEKERHPSVAIALRLKPNNLPSEVTSPTQYYPALLELVRAVLDGNMEPAAYEDATREMFGIRAYPAYTLDKLVTYSVRQLQHCVSEKWSWRAAELASRALKVGAGAGSAGYVRQARHFLCGEHTAFLLQVYGGMECRVSFSLLDNTIDERSSPQDNSRLSPTNQPRSSNTNGTSVSRVAAWSAYAERYSRPHIGGTGPRVTGGRPVFLRRNARRGGCAHTSSNAAPASGNSSAGSSAAGQGASHHRRKPARLVDSSECTLGSSLRLVASRPHHLYRPGALRTARELHNRLHTARRNRFREWVRRQDRPHDTQHLLPRAS